MESSGRPAAYAVGRDDAPELSRLFEHDGPFVTVAITTESSRENAAQRSLQHWRPIRDELATQRVDAATLDAIEELVPDAHLRGPSLYAIAAEGRVLLDKSLPDPPARDRGTTGAVPSILPLVDDRQRHLPHILVLADRTGADILAIGPEETSATVAGDNDAKDPAISKSAPGGWSQRRYQERAERTWEENAKSVADRVKDVARLIDPAAILVAGDVRAVAYLRDHLDPHLAEIVRELDGARGQDGGDDAIAEAARKQIATTATIDTVALLDKFREEQGQRDRATEGVAPTIDALNASAVETLLVADDPEDDRLAWFAPDQPLSALTGDDLETYGVRNPEQGRLADVLVRNAFLTGARVRVVPRAVVQEGVGAVLRFNSA